MSAILLTTVAILPGIAWLIFFLREDVHPEPRRAIMHTFFVGAAMAFPIVVVSLWGKSAIDAILPSSLLLLVYLAFVEEIGKWFATYTAVGDKNVLTEPVDYMIYMIASGLGFATLENFLAVTNTISFPFTAGEIVAEGALDLTVLRFVGAVFLHAAASGLVGFYWAESKVQSSWKPLAWGIGLATVVHATFNFFVYAFQDYDMLIYPTLFLIVVAVFLMQDFEKLREFEEEVEHEGVDHFS